MTQVPESPARQRAFWLLPLLLLVVLAGLFHPSFTDPDYVLFSNDGPLGAISCKAGEVPYAFTGYWQDLNWIGYEVPSAVANLTVGINYVLQPYLFSRFYAPTTLLVVGLCAGFLFRCLKLHPIACILGGLAAALNMENVSYVCWGLGSRPLAMAVFLLAVAALAGGTRFRWIRLALAGFATGMGVMEGADFGAIYSLYIGAFVLWLAWIEPGSPAKRLGGGALRMAVVVVCAGLLAAQALHTLVGTQVKGVVGMEQDQKTKDQRWDEATRWSLPKIETLRLFIPGIFGYKMPELYGEPTESAGGSNYWGAVGQAPGVAASRHSGSGEHAGGLVVLLAIFAAAQACRRQNNPFTDLERRWVWFWSGAAVVSLVLSWGRHTPFYQLVYALPWFSTIRNPIKFLHPLHLSLIILFGFGVQAICRRYLDRPLASAKSLQDSVKAWWASAQAPDRRWGRGILFAVAASALLWLLYAASRNEMLRFLRQAGFSEEYAPKIHAFSVGEVGWFVLFFALSAGVLVAAFSGALAGSRAKWAGLLLGAILLTDLSRSASPWISYFNYKERYATNPVLDQLRDKPWERRVTTLPLQVNENYSDFQQFYYREWLQHQFQYYNIQSLDVVQMPRPPHDRVAFVQASVKAPVRVWELTSTRWFFGLPAIVDPLNQQLDPGRRRFRLLTPFTLVPSGKSYVAAQPDTNGYFALLEFTGALPRASLYSHWEVQTNQTAAFDRILEPAFEPTQSVVVTTPIAPPPPGTTNAPAGPVEFKHYEPKRVVLSARADSPSVLLLNDRFADAWKVRVDGAEQTLLRCNYWMRGVQVPVGAHEVEFSFEPTIRWFRLSLICVATALGLWVFLAFAGRGRSDDPPAPVRA